MARLNELNLKSNNLSCLENLRFFPGLRSFNGACNELKKFEDAIQIFKCTYIQELILEGNSISEETLYRPIFTNFLKSLKSIDGKRVTEEDRRTSAKIIRREEDRRKECSRNQFVLEKKSKTMEKIKEIWHQQNSGDLKDNDNNNSNILDGIALSCPNLTRIRCRESRNISRRATRNPTCDVRLYP